MPVNVIPIISTALEDCSEVIEQPLTIFVFPTVNEFIVKKMHGVVGIAPQPNTIILFLYKTKDYQEWLRNTVAHELCHAITLKNNPGKTIGDELVAEGLAEHFRERYVGGTKAPWVQSINYRQAQE